MRSNTNSGTAVQVSEVDTIRKQPKTL
jgi:hypothetical protein